MSSSIDVPTEKLCYIPCNFCNIILAVSVPCSSLTDIVTVRCGHCTNLWSVNMAATFHSSSQSMSSPSPQDYVQAPNCANCTSNYRVELGSSSKCNNRYPIREPTMDLTNEHVVNRPPEKRPRVPSAYNQFIKEEIQRLKANNPEISHRDAFSTAAKNWAHFPNIHFGLMLETNNNLSKLNEQGSAEKHLQQRTGSIFN